MLDLQMMYRGGGTFQTRTKLDFELSETEFERGEELRAKVGRKRSTRQNDFFHAIIVAAFDNQRGGLSLPTWRHLKSHLLISAGHCDEVRVSLKGMPKNDVASVIGPIAVALRRQYDTVETSYDPPRHEAVLRFAKSWKFAKTDSTTAGAITDTVVAIICAEIVPGTTADELFEMAKGGAE